MKRSGYKGWEMWFRKEDAERDRQGAKWEKGIKTGGEDLIKIG